MNQMAKKTNPIYFVNIPEHENIIIIERKTRNNHRLCNQRMFGILAYVHLCRF